MTDLYAAPQGVGTKLSQLQTPPLNTDMKMSAAMIKDSEALLDKDGVAVRTALESDGALLWEIARDAKGIDLNSPYAYMMMCQNFSETSAVVEVYGQPAGFVTAYRLPKRPQVLFVWQIAVLPEFRGLGIGQRLLDGLVTLPGCTTVRTMETTVTPSNSASEALFRGFAKTHGAHLDIREGFASTDFPDDAPGDAERLFVIHPLHPID
jgi:L-2,4-diaminobutyric acid acetyltransferase